MIRPTDRHLLDIAWVIPPVFTGSGGHMTIFRNVAYLSDLGHRNTLYCADFDSKFQSDGALQDFIHEHFVDTNAQVVRGWDLKPCDIAVATHWTTAYPVHEFSHCSKKFYFVQDYEPYFHSMGVDYLRAENSYRLGFSCITIGRWLTHLLRERFDADVDYFDFAVDKSTYYLRGITPREARVAFCAQPEKPRRCFELGARALEIVHRLRPEVDIVFFGSDTKPNFPINFPHRNLGIVTPEMCAELYSSSRLGLILSSSNPSLIGFEMMACGCAVVDLDCENNWFDYEPGTVSLAEATPQAIAQAIVQLQEDDSKRSQQAQRALQMISQRSYEQAARKVESLMLKGWITARISPVTDLILDEFQSLAEEEVRLESGCTQVFRCSQDNLCRLDVFFAKKDTSDSQSSVLFDLYDIQDQRTVATLTASAKEIGHLKWHSFSIPRQSASAGRTYRLTLRCEGKSTSGPNPLYTRRHVYRGGEFYLGSQRTDGALKFKTYCAAHGADASFASVRRKENVHAPGCSRLMVSDDALRVGAGALGAIECAESTLGNSHIPQGETLLIKGWISESLLDASSGFIDVEIDAIPFGKASLNKLRREVRPSSGSSPPLREWSFALDASKLSLGSHKVAAVVLSREAGRLQLGESRTIEITAEPTREAFSEIIRILRNWDPRTRLPQKASKYTLRDLVIALDYPGAGILIRFAKLLVLIKHYWVWTCFHFHHGGLKAVLERALRRVQVWVHAPLEGRFQRDRKAFRS